MRRQAWAVTAVLALAGCVSHPVGPARTYSKWPSPWPTWPSASAISLPRTVAGVAIALSLVTSVDYLLLIPFTAVLVWLVLWRLPFEWMERCFGLLGLALIVFAVVVSTSAPTGTPSSARRRTHTCPPRRRHSPTPTTASPFSGRPQDGPLVPGFSSPRHNFPTRS